VWKSTTVCITLAVLTMLSTKVPWRTTITVSAKSDVQSGKVLKRRESDEKKSTVDYKVGKQSTSDFLVITLLKFPFLLLNSRVELYGLSNWVGWSNSNPQANQCSNKITIQHESTKANNDADK
jgi:hypothetical protein